MPPTPLHFTGLAWLHFRSPGRIDLAALAFSTMILDLEPPVRFFLGQLQPFSFFHNYVSATGIGVLSALFVYFLEREFPRIILLGYRLLRLRPKTLRYSVKQVLATSLIGCYSHVFIDKFTHETFPQVLLPFSYGRNPFWFGILPAIIVEAIVVALSLYSLILWIRRIRKWLT